MSEAENVPKFAYSVEVIGFNQTERIMMSTIFRLSARRMPKFTQHNSLSYPPDLFVVDASDPHAITLFLEHNAARRAPAVLIGDSDHGTGYAALARPLQWTKLFEAFDSCVAQIKAVMGSSENPQHVVMAPAVSRSLPAAATAAAPAPTSFTGAPPVPAAPVQRLQVSAPAAPTWAAAAPSVPRAAAVAAPAVAADWVLVVDDNHTVREFMKTKLTPFGFNIDYAESGEQAIGLTGQKNYTCIFLDVIMAGIDGYQVCKLIKSKKLARKTAVVMLTSKGSPFDKIRGAMAGCDAYLTKPVDEEKLLATIVKYLPNAA